MGFLGGKRFKQMQAVTGTHMALRPHAFQACALPGYAIPAFLRNAEFFNFRRSWRDRRPILYSITANHSFQG
jgi:hypothetical protein